MPDDLWLSSISNKLFILLTGNFHPTGNSISIYPCQFFPKTDFHFQIQVFKDEEVLINVLSISEIKGLCPNYHFLFLPRNHQPFLLGWCLSASLFDILFGGSGCFSIQLRTRLRQAIGCVTQPDEGKAPPLSPSGRWQPWKQQQQLRYEVSRDK